MPGTIRTSLTGLSDVGKRRQNNEDSILLVDLETDTKIEAYSVVERDPSQNSLLLIVSDGMGGYEGGEVASKITVDAIWNELTRMPKQLSPHSRMESAIEEANRRVWKYKSGSPVLQKMGATATAVLIERDRAYIADVGDSRAFIIRDGRIKQLTTDQTITQMLVQVGAMTEEEAANSQRKNILLQAIGSNEFLQIPASALQLQRGDILVLCSDGLTTKLQNRELMMVIQSQGSLDAAARELIRMANDRGGEDNISVVIAKFEGEGLEAKIQAETLTKQIEIYASYNPSQSAEARPKREIREATFQDWMQTAVLGRFCQSQEQLQKLATLSSFGDYIVFRKGDYLQPSPDQSDHYWLVSGRYRILYSRALNNFEPYCFFVSPTDQRTDAEIQNGEMLVRVRRQFFINTLAMLGEYPKAIRCEDEENAMIRIPYEVYRVIESVLGESYVHILSKS